MTGSTTTTPTEEPMAADPPAGASTHPLAEGQQAADSAGHMASRTVDLGLQQADRGRQQAANGLEHVADSIRRITSDMQAEQPAIANAAGAAAEQAERVATYMREHDAREILGNIEGFARRQPLLFLGGAFALGVAASRFIKAAGGGQSPDRADDRSGAYGLRSAAGYPNSSAYGATGRGPRNGNEGF